MPLRLVSRSVMCLILKVGRAAGLKYKMKRLFSFFNLQILLVAITLIWTFGFANLIEIYAEDEVSTLIVALRKSGINVPEQIDYSKLVQKLQSMQIDVHGAYKESVLNYLDSRRASGLIKIQTSKPGILTWHFHGVIFLKKDLIFAQYDDGEMFGGDILIKVLFSENQATAMKALWSYH